MANIQLNPDAEIDLMISISTQLAGRTDFASFAIRNAIKENQPADKILSCIKDMATDNYSIVKNILTSPLTDKILAL